MTTKVGIMHNHRVTDRLTGAPSRRMIGVELEVAVSKPSMSQLIMDTIDKWGGRIVHDGSLPDSGYEINTAPASGRTFETQINEICAILKAANAGITKECGMHVHIDTRDLDWFAIRRLARLYEAVDSALRLCVPESRRANTFATAPKRAKGLVGKEQKHIRDGFRQVLYKLTPQDKRKKPTDKGGDYHYDALNLHSYTVRGTVEYRLAAGTVTPERVIEWAYACAGLVDAAVRLTDAQVDAIMAAAPAGHTKKSEVASGRKILEAVLPARPLAWLQKRNAKFTPANLWGANTPADTFAKDHGEDN